MNDQEWHEAIARLAGGQATLLGLWGDAPDVHMALLDEGAGDIDLLTYACVDGRIPQRRRAAPAGAAA